MLLRLTQPAVWLCSVCLGSHSYAFRFHQLDSCCKCRSLCFNQYSFLDWTLPPTPVASRWKVREELPAWTPAGTNSVFFKLTGMRDGHFFCGSLARQREVITWILLNWFNLNHHLCAVFPFLEHFVSVFTLETVCLFLCWTHAKIKIYIFISMRLKSMTWPHLLLLHMCSNSGHLFDYWGKFLLKFFGSNSELFDLSIVLIAKIPLYKVSSNYSSSTIIPICLHTII